MAASRERSIARTKRKNSLSGSRYQSVDQTRWIRQLSLPTHFVEGGPGRAPPSKNGT